MLKNDYLFPDVKPQDKPCDLPNMYPHHKDCLMTPPHHLTLQEEFIHTSKKVNETLERVLRMEDNIRKTLDNYIANISSDNVTFKNLCVTTYNQFAKEVTLDVNEFESNMENSVKLFQDAVSAECNELKEAYLAKLEEYKITLSGSFNGFTENMTAQMRTFETDITNDLNAHKTELNGTYDNFRTAIENRLDQYNSNYVKTFNDFVTSVNNKLSAMEAKFNADYAGFTAEVNASITEINKTLDERLDGQDATINDAVLYMKANLRASVSELVAQMKLNGDFDQAITEIITPGLNKVINDTRGIISPVISDVDNNIVEAEDIKNALNSTAHIVLLGEGNVGTQYQLYNIEVGSNKHLIGSQTATYYCKYQNGHLKITGDNVIIENFNFACTMPVEQLIKVTGKNVTIKNCHFPAPYYMYEDADHILTQLYLDGAENVIIDGCTFDKFESKGTNRHIYSINSKNVTVRNCTFNGVSGGSEDDCLHFKSDNLDSTGANFDNILIENCYFTTLMAVVKRHLKIQQNGVTVRNCKFMAGFPNSLADISVYGNNCLIDGNKMFTGTPVAIQIGHGDELNNITIVNNNIQSYANSGQGIINTSYQIIASDGGYTTIKNLVISNNALVNINETFPNDYGICLRAVNIDRMNITGNIIKNLSCGIAFREETENKKGMTISNVTITSNNFDVNYNGVMASLVSGDKDYNIVNLSVTGNTAIMHNSLSQQFVSMLNSCVNFPVANSIKIMGNVIASDNAYEYRREKGYLNALPTENLVNGIKYFAYDDKLTYTYYDGKWYKPDGTEKA